MAFTNVWDTTFPPDTQLANLLGQDIRNGVKVDVQQRMAAISGLDAAKPTFGTDAQPANWNGILFFATDTGRIYQFVNPTWTDITAAFNIGGSRVLFKDGAQHVNTGNTTLNTIYTANIPILTTQNQLRMRLALTIGAQAGASSAIPITLGATTLLNIPVTAAAAGSNEHFLDLLLVNRNNVASQLFIVADNGSSGLLNGNGVYASLINTGIANTLLVQCQNGANGDSITFDSFSVELL